MYVWNNFGFIFFALKVQKRLKGKADCDQEFTIDV